VVRLEHIRDLADQFVRVRLTRIEDLDLNLFEFDYDVTFMVFFLDKDERVYARYGGRDADSPDRRQSLEGLRYTMQSVLQMHAGGEKAFAPKSQEAPRHLRPGLARSGSGRCLHCHEVKEALNAEVHRAGKWSRDLIWRYPLPENLGFALTVDQGNVVGEVRDRSPAAVAGLKAGDVVRRLNGVPIHSFADAQLALDRAMQAGSIGVAWQRGNQTQRGSLRLPDGWRRTDISWRTSMQDYVPSARLYGTDLTPAEKQGLGLAANQLAFRQKYPISDQAKAAGIREGDIILGVDDKRLALDRIDFHTYVRSNYLVGDRLTVNLLRDGKRQKLSMMLVR
jgi:hypothetical protein